MRIIKDLKRRALDHPYFQRIYIKRKRSINELLSGTDPLLLGQKDPVLMEDPPHLKVGLVKDHHALKRVPFSAYWPKYESFLKNNGIPHMIYEAHRSDWIESSEDLDLIVLRVNSDPVSLEEAREKIYFLENFLGKRCFPSSHKLWSNEDKLREYFLVKENSIPSPIRPSPTAS
jgi:hypothetical protein